MAKLIQMEGPLFEAVQLERIFKDSKTFVDAVPKGDPLTILRSYERERNTSGFDLKAFVHEHFDLPKAAEASKDLPLDTSSLEGYIDSLWPRLRREPADAEPNDTLIPLKHPYIVPGGRFREIYYWDSYFTFLGLAEAGQLDMVENMVRNLVHLQGELGHIPNGNRHYFATRSQPPVLSLMVRLLWDERYRDAEDGVERIAEFLPALEREHRFWMSTARAVKLTDGTLLNRYWDSATTPRQESYGEDFDLGQESRFADDLYQNIRAAAESGWDFSSRWLKVPGELGSIQTTDLLPVDLNCLLYLLETSLVGYYGLLGDADKQASFLEAAETRKEAIQTLFWNQAEGYYFDYSWRTRKQTNIYSLAGVLPLFARIAEGERAERVKDKLMNDFLKPGGLVTSLSGEGEQWDNPNGWAPLQWFAIVGLKHYGFDAEAKEIATRWLSMIRGRFESDRKLLEKYDVVNLDKKPGGGEYEVQEGFGWTNGVTLKLLKLYS